MKDTVIVVTRPELGWDCVVGVYPDEATAVKLINKYDGKGNQLTQQELEDVFNYCFLTSTLKGSNSKYYNYISYKIYIINKVI